LRFIETKFRLGLGHELALDLVDSMAASLATAKSTTRVRRGYARLSDVQRFVQQYFPVLLREPKMVFSLVIRAAETSHMSGCKSPQRLHDCTPGVVAVARQGCSPDLVQVAQQASRVGAPNPSLCWPRWRSERYQVHIRWPQVQTFNITALTSRRIVSGGDDKCLCLWDALSGDVRQSLPAPIANVPLLVDHPHCRTSSRCSCRRHRAWGAPHEPPRWRSQRRLDLRHGFARQDCASLGHPHDVARDVGGGGILSGAAPRIQRSFGASAER
jgi:hypothetical protein